MSMHYSEDFIGWPDERVVFPLAALELRVLPGDHPFYLAERDAIAENWTKEVAANPALFDGRMLFQKRLELRDGKLLGESHIVPFSTFMWWRRQEKRHGGVHLFAYPVLATSDDALVAIRMGAHTANPGQVYFAAGSFEPEDVVDGYCDVEANMRRELLEETGFDLSDAQADDGFFAVRNRRVVTLLKVFRFDLTAEEVIEKIEEHMVVADDKEIAGAVAIRSADPKAHPYNIAMLPVIEWYFGQKVNR